MAGEKARDTAGSDNKGALTFDDLVVAVSQRNARGAQRRNIAILLEAEITGQDHACNVEFCAQDGDADERTGRQRQLDRIAQQHHRLDDPHIGGVEFQFDRLGGNRNPGHVERGGYAQGTGDSEAVEQQDPLPAGNLDDRVQPGAQRQRNARGDHADDLPAVQGYLLDREVSADDLPGDRQSQARTRQANELGARISRVNRQVERAVKRNAR